jgi:hypothetical protein
MLTKLFNGGALWKKEELWRFVTDEDYRLATLVGNFVVGVLVVTVE